MGGGASKRASKPAPDPDAACRICLEATRRSDLVSPCSCSGSQRWVHLECLRKWQHLSASESAAVTCNVCCTPFSYPPKSPRQKPIAAGMLLVAPPGERGPYFTRAVVLITEATLRGDVLGVVLTLPAYAAQRASVASASPWRSAAGCSAGGRLE